MQNIGRNYQPGERKSGFTLVELLAVVVLVALLAGAAGGIYFKSYQNRLLAKEARQMLLTAKYARLAAIEGGKVCWMKFDPQNNRYWLEIENELENIVVKNQYSRLVEFSDNIKLENVQIKSEEDNYASTATTDAMILFNPNGTADNAVVTITNGVMKYYLTVCGPTGKSKLQSAKPDAALGEAIDLDE